MPELLLHSLFDSRVSHAEVKGQLTFNFFSFMYANEPLPHCLSVSLVSYCVVAVKCKTNYVNIPISSGSLTSFTTNDRPVVIIKNISIA